MYKIVRAYFFQNAPYISKLEDGSVEGFIPGLLDEMGVDYEIVSPPDGRYGAYNQSTGKWTGMIGMVVDGVRNFRHIQMGQQKIYKGLTCYVFLEINFEIFLIFQRADAAGQDITMTSKRAQDVDFTVPFMSSDLVIMAKEVST